MVFMWSNSEQTEKTTRGVYSPLFFILVGAITLLALAASIGPLNNLIVRYVLCPTASAAYFQASGVGILGMDRDTSGVSTELYCNYGDGRVRRFEYVAISIASFGGSVGIGALTGLMLYLAIYTRVGITRPEA